ncbi:hypothetical protein [Sporolactobacillus nakayamae]|uniref:Uncharacterized protein n=1 Tax=Sporolactobacillus nakayamae TaxID=269670 RepID=A0A1I2MZV3_9BACL|nr:hypothetical protein [Sporolactobacillus nakayamae]SFF94846.1 hypothetical protein SAMN02982927_00085 [Sporolactobacillus nakayamae]
MFAQLKGYWDHYVQENRRQVIALGLCTPLLIGIPALVAVIMIHGTFFEAVFNFLFTLVFIALFACLPLFLLSISSVWSQQFRITWTVISSVFFILWFILFQLTNFYF